ncbi:MAG: hypothetical protein Q8834_02550 [Candidatus Phytoplasma australasiaticum]|nr:hypothetical protein [Candidatus Phytoplasma australasiaticum]
MPLAMFKKLGPDTPSPIRMWLLMADRTIKNSEGILLDMLVKVDKFIFPIDFMILDCDVDFEVIIILGRPFLANGRALVDMDLGQLWFRVSDAEVLFDICQSLKHLDELKSGVWVLEDF